MKHSYNSHYLYSLLIFTLSVLLDVMKALQLHNNLVACLISSFYETAKYSLKIKVSSTKSELRWKYMPFYCTMTTSPVYANQITDWNKFFIGYWLYLSQLEHEILFICSDKKY